MQESHKTIKKWMIYGAYGYTGKLIAEEAVRRGHLPIIAGRDESKLLDLAEQLNLTHKAFALDHPRKIKSQFEDVGLVLNCAGPFSQTATALRDACVASGVHYLDITGEIPVLEASYQTHEKAKEAGCVVISGVGFDVVPTDTLAYLLKQQLPTATHLELAFAGGGGVSPGTAKTMVEMMSERGQVRQAGEITQVPLAYDNKLIQFSDMARDCMTIPWGDIATAYYTTGIPNIMVYTAVEKNQIKMMKRVNCIVSVFSFRWVQNLLHRLITKNIAGPTQEQRNAGFMRIWGKVSDGKKEVTMTMDTPEGYNYTVLSALLAVESLIAHKVMPGAYTPSQALDIEAIIGMEGVTLATINH